jgi:hypothetical protein
MEILMFIPYSYALGFFPGHKRKKLPPAITFTIKHSAFEHVINTMRLYQDRFYEHTKKYLKGLDTHFTLPSYDLFGRSMFGFGNCGRFEKKDDELTFFVEIGKSEAIYFATLTIHALSITLHTEENVPTNREQQVELSTRTDRQAFGWGHILSGNIAMSAVRWIAHYAKGHALYDSYWSTPMHPDVVAAMRTTWIAMSDKRMRQWSRDNSGVMSQDGRFILSCFGNACDIAIYPDIFMHEELEYVQFSCHNLDSADQQLTLLAGLAKLLELARKDAYSTALL